MSDTTPRGDTAATAPGAATRRTRLAVAGAALLGVIHAACFSVASGWWVQVAVFALLFMWLSTSSRPARDAGLAGLGFGLGTFCAGVGWLFISMHRYGGLPAPLAIAAVMLLSAYLALFGAAALAAAEALAPANARGGRRLTGRVVALAACWTLAEALRGWLFTGFPWLSLGYAQVDGPLAPAAAAVGVYGLGGLVVACAGALAALVQAPAGRRSPAFAVAAGVAIVAAGLVLAGRLAPIAPAGAPVEVSLLQGNVEQGMKFDPARSLRAMNDYTESVVASDARLIVLPETAWTTVWSATPPPIARRLREHIGRTDAFLSIGLPLRVAAPDGAAGDGRYGNAVLTLGPDGAEAARYVKRQLVPFGEFIPAGFGWFVRMMRIPLGEFARGAADQPPLAIDGQSFAFNICYEDLFPMLLRRQVNDGATVLVNVSNIAWFGHSHALGQHLNISRLRAIELGRPMLRATNTGMTASIDARGRVISVLPPVAGGTLDVAVQGVRGTTPFVRFGHAPALIAAALAIAGLLWMRRRRPLSG